jgi:hypothetical protein
MDPNLFQVITFLSSELIMPSDYSCTDYIPGSHSPSKASELCSINVS